MGSARLRSVCVFVMLAACPIGNLVAEQSEVLTNETVVKMVAGKVAKTFITAKIASTPNSFDVSPTALIGLATSRVPSDVIIAMLKAQPRSPVLDNRGVIDLVAAKLTESLILQKIQSSPVNFDLTADGLVTLTQAKVNTKVIKAMMAAGSTPAAAPAPIVAPEKEKKEPPATKPAIEAVTKVPDGQAATFTTSLSVADALNKVKGYFNSQNIDFTVNADTNRILSDWYNERSCGPGFQKCANKANVRVATENSRTAVTVQVFERKREAGLSNKPWNENAKSKGKETTELASALSSLVR